MKEFLKLVGECYQATRAIGEIGATVSAVSKAHLTKVDLTISSFVEEGWIHEIEGRLTVGPETWRGFLRWADKPRFSSGFWLAFAIVFVLMVVMAVLT